MKELVAQYPVEMLREWKSAQIAAYERAVEAGRDAGWQLTDDQAAEVVEESERRVRVMVHRAFFTHGHDDKRQQFFIWVTNLSPQRRVEITHIWFETNPPTHILNPVRPLPKRLRLDERWETWIADIEDYAAAMPIADIKPVLPGASDGGSDGCGLPSSASRSRRSIGPAPASGIEQIARRSVRSGTDHLRSSWFSTDRPGGWEGTTIDNDGKSDG